MNITLNQIKKLTITFSFLKQYGKEKVGDRRWFRCTTTSSDGNTSVCFMSESIALNCPNKNVTMGTDATFKVVPAMADICQLFGIYYIENGSVSLFLLIKNI